ncbi:hypothetical protein DsansV1_C25g0189221 [Dioscorea sansibarensis]
MFYFKFSDGLSLSIKCRRTQRSSAFLNWCTDIYILPCFFPADTGVYIYINMISALKKMKLAVCWFLVFFGLMMQPEMTTLTLASDVSAWDFSTSMGLNHAVDWLPANLQDSGISARNALSADRQANNESPRGQSYQRGCEKKYYC